MNNNKEYVDFLEKFGQTLRGIRLEKGLTLEQVEELGYITWRHLQRIEKGKNVNLTTVKRISEMYNIPLSKLFLKL